MVKIEHMILSFQPFSDPSQPPEESSTLAWTRNGTYFCHDQELDRMLNTLGAAGWQISAVTGHGGRIFLQRVVAQQTEPRPKPEPFMDDSITEEENHSLGISADPSLPTRTSSPVEVSPRSAKRFGQLFPNLSGERR
jgi:hypothetical protein